MKILIAMISLLPFGCVFAEESSEKQMDVTHRYLELIHRISQGESFSPEATSLLAPNCHKIFNGKVYTETREDFISDLLQVYQNQGGWNVSPVELIQCPQSKTTVLRLMIDMEKFGAFTAIVILRFDSEYLITEINEVFNRVEDSYHFEES